MAKKKGVNPATYQRVQKIRQSISDFSPLVNTPATGSFVMPASALLAYVPDHNVVIDESAGTIVGVSTRTVTVPAGYKSGDKFRVEWVEMNNTVTANAGYAVHFHVGLGVFKKVMNGA